MEQKEKGIEVTVAEVVDYLRIIGQFSPALHEVVKRKVTAEAARESGIKVTTTQIQEAADAFREGNELSKVQDTERWFSSNGISLETFEEYLEINILISKFKNALENKASKTRYASAQTVKETIRELMYQDWLNSQFS